MASSTKQAGEEQVDDGPTDFNAKSYYQNHYESSPEHFLPPSVASHSEPSHF